MNETVLKTNPSMKLNDVDVSLLSPMMQQYVATRKEYSDCILFYRLGDFYEMFFEDAVTVSRELELTLTGKNCGLPERAPMCGVPFHAVDSYLTRLVDKGYKVAICEQLEDPKLAKGIVKRDVIRIVTPGTNIDIASLDEQTNHYIFSVFYDPHNCGVAVSDISTGDFLVTEVAPGERLMDEILRYHPAEILCNEAFLLSGIDTQFLRTQVHAALTPLDARYHDTAVCSRILLKHFRASSMTALGIADFPSGQAAAGALLTYLYETQKNDLACLTHVTAYTTGKYMLLDSVARRSLELTETIREKEKRGSLLWVLDKTKTAMGARLLRRCLAQPLIDRTEIEKRLDAVSTLSDNSVDRDELREYLQPVYDLERLMTRISYLSANARDLIALSTSLSMIRPIRSLLQIHNEGLLGEILNDTDDFEDLTGLLTKAINDDPPMSIREGGFIRDGYSADIDSLRDIAANGKQWLMDLEEEDRARTGIKNLKIKYNKVFGYYFDVTNSFKDLVPDDYIRKQTLVGSERYTNEKLKDLEDKILNAKEKLNALEYDAFCEIRDRIAAQTERIQKAAHALAMLDVMCSFSLVAERNGYVRPQLNDKGVIDIHDGRHPVVEQMLHGDFVPNDTYLDNKKHAISVITGPNMAGKSTYMRQTALIVLMMQIGSFVPAKKADLCIVDRIFTRVGASDDLSSGQSTFMVEMNEVAGILRNATKDSLLILDEIGRGTSTFDGLSIAWAVIEHISSKKLLGAKTLFATHYHELTELEGKIENVNNYCVAVKENGDDIAFLRKIVKGGADRSYGIQVARLAGIPDMVIDRAKEIAEELSDNDITDRLQDMEKGIAESGKRKKMPHYDDVDLSQMSLSFEMNRDQVLEELKNADIPSMTPLDALNMLYRMQNELKNTWQ